MARKRDGCARRGCRFILSALVVLTAVAVVAALLFTNVPERIGLRQPVAERLLSGPPDREAAKAITDELAAAGFDTEGVSVFVLPVKGEEHQVAYAVLDASEGFGFGDASGDDPIVGSLLQLAGAAAEAHGIERVAIEYRDRDGETKLAMTAPVAALSQFANGAISHEELMQSIDGRAGLPTIYQEMLP